MDGKKSKEGRTKPGTALGVLLGSDFGGITGGKKIIWSTWQFCTAGVQQWQGWAQKAQRMGEVFTGALYRSGVKKPNAGNRQGAAAYDRFFGTGSSKCSHWHNWECQRHDIRMLARWHLGKYFSIYKVAFQWINTMKIKCIHAFSVVEIRLLRHMHGNELISYTQLKISWFAFFHDFLLTSL